MTRFAAPAETDLTEIWCHIAADSFDFADQLVDEITEACELLGRHPGLGPLREELGDYVRTYLVRSYVILYRECPGGAIVLRVIHGARNIVALLGSAFSSLVIEVAKLAA
jgi:toxin ParE1/3/4